MIGIVSTGYIVDIWPGKCKRKRWCFGHFELILVGPTQKKKKFPSFSIVVSTNKQLASKCIFGKLIASNSMR